MALRRRVLSTWDRRAAGLTAAEILTSSEPPFLWGVTAQIQKTFFNSLTVIEPFYIDANPIEMTDDDNGNGSRKEHHVNTRPVRGMPPPWVFAVISAEPLSKMS